MRNGIATLLLAILLASVIATSQNPPARKSSAKDLPSTAFKLISVQVKGANHYKESQIVAASGLGIGQTVSEDDFKRAVQRLGETGAFSETAYSFQYSALGTKVELQVTENRQLVRVRFENLVWFPDQELLDKLQARVPLFQGELPLSGNLIDEVSESLQGLLDARNIQGKVDYLRTAREGGPLEAIAFSVTGPAILIRSTEFPGAAPAELPLLQSVAKKLIGQEYLRSMLRLQEEKNFLPVYSARGYLKASFGDAQAKVVQDSNQEVAVDVSFPIEPGRQYKVAEVHWAGNSVFPEDKLQPFIHLAAGNPANVIQLTDDLEGAKKLYGTRGYLATAIQAAPEFNEEASTVSYQLQVREGDVYHMGELEIRGLDTRTTARVGDQWKLHEGDTFDNAYPKAFIENVLKDPSLNGWLATVHLGMNDDKTVDVTLRFEARK
jgi:outer membrane protein insertion porin family